MEAVEGFAFVVGVGVLSDFFGGDVDAEEAVFVGADVEDVGIDWVDRWAVAVAYVLAEGIVDDGAAVVGPSSVFVALDEVVEVHGVGGEYGGHAFVGV